MTETMNIAIKEYFELRQINEIPKFVKDKIYNEKVSYANTITDLTNEEKTNYINAYTKPDSSSILQVTNLEK